jgi:hypothetical protein
MYTTAILLTEELLRQPETLDSDFILFGRCFFAKREYRRCLGALEQSDLLHSQGILQIADLFNPDPNSTSIDSNQITAINTLETRHINILEALLLASQCLIELEQYEDCVHLVEPLLTLVDNEVIIHLTAQSTL